MRTEFRVRILSDGGERFFGEGPYRLLRGVERLGSLRAAAGEMGMAYSKANRVMSRAERLLGAPLTQKRIGGPDGGGSTLTPLAQSLLARYEAFRADCEASVEASFARNFEGFTLSTDGEENAAPPARAAANPRCSAEESQSANPREPSRLLGEPFNEPASDRAARAESDAANRPAEAGEPALCHDELSEQVAAYSIAPGESDAARFPGKAEELTVSRDKSSKEPAPCRDEPSEQVAAYSIAPGESDNLRFPGEAEELTVSRDKSSKEPALCHDESSGQVVAFRIAPGESDVARFPGEAGELTVSRGKSSKEPALCHDESSEQVAAYCIAPGASDASRFPGEAGELTVSRGKSSKEPTPCRNESSEQVAAYRIAPGEADASRFPAEAEKLTVSRGKSSKESEPCRDVPLRTEGDASSVALGCVVLAAGKARRFGGGKLLADLNGEAVLARTLDALPRERFSRIVAVTSDPEVAALCRARGIFAREYPGGPLSESIREGLSEMNGTGGCMFVNGDQPLLRPGSLRRLADAFAENPERACRLAWKGTAASPAIFPASAYPALRELAGESGGASALKSGNWEIRAVEAEDESELWDVDEPAELAAIRRHALAMGLCPHRAEGQKSCVGSPEGSLAENTKSDP